MKRFKKRRFEEINAKLIEQKNLEAWPCQTQTASYSIRAKKGHLIRLFRELERQGKLGKNILDVGSGPEFQSMQPGRTVEDFGTYAVFYNTAGKKVIRLDAGFPESKQQQFFLELKANLHDLREVSRKNVVPIRLATKFFNARKELRERTPVVDSIVTTDVLNYLDYSKVLQKLLTFLKPGGRLIIRHSPENGVKTLFHPKRPKTIEGLVRFLKHVGLRIEHCGRKDENFPTLEPRALKEKESPHAHIVAVKPMK